MGLSWSSYKSKRKEKKDYKRLLDQYQNSLPDGSTPGNESAPDDCVVTEIEGDVQALERKLFLEKVALNVTDERCYFLDRNFRLLQSNEVSLHRQSSFCEADLAAFNKLKQEASQFGQFLKANLIEDWVVRSLPNLYFKEL
ncbi:uncharacterized protein LOC144652644 isoform X2 [Oculina patagonica]